MRSLLAAAAAALALTAPAVALADPAGDAVARYVAWRGGPAFEKATGLLIRGTTDNGRFQGALERRIEPGRMVERYVLGSAVTHQAFIGDGGSAPSSRSFDFANLASESISGVEVYKSGRATIESGGIGSSINIRTKAKSSGMGVFGKM